MELLDHYSKIFKENFVLSQTALVNGHPTNKWKVVYESFLHKEQNLRPSNPLH
jgi:hypothetical protein